MSATVYLLLILLWPADGSAPVMGGGVAPSLEACQQAKADVLAQASADPKVRYVDVECLPRTRGEKS